MNTVNDSLLYEIFFKEKLYVDKLYSFELVSKSIHPIKFNIVNIKVLRPIESIIAHQWVKVVKGNVPN